jgi:hypothetical protein
MSKYRTETNDLGIEYIVRTNDDGSESWIPKDEANADYQAYLNPGEQSTPSVTNGD